jgi:hypothetical protein
MGRPILYLGDEKTDTWQMLGEGGWIVRERPDGSWSDEEIRAALTSIANPRVVETRRQAAERLSARLLHHRAQTLSQIGAWLEGLSAAG